MSHSQSEENRSSAGDRIPCPKCGYPILALAPTCKWCSVVLDPAAGPATLATQSAAVETIPDPANLVVALSCRRELSGLSRAELVEERDLLSRESARLWRKGWLCLTCGAGTFLLLLSVIAQFRNLEGIILVQLAIGLLTTGTIAGLVLGFITFARSKGLPAAFAILCLLGPIGLVILLTFPNRYTDRLQIIDALLSWRSRVENKLSAGDLPDIAGSAT